MRRGRWFVVASTLAVAAGAIAACFVPQHRFGDPPEPDAPLPPDVAKLELVSIPSGVALQGTYEGIGVTSTAFDMENVPVHRVFTSGFEISRTCVTEQQYAACVAAGACTALFDDGGQIGLGLLLSSQAEAYCAWEGLRLPTEAELERAMRGEDNAKIVTVSPYGLEECFPQRTTLFVADGYQCDGYVGRAWANPQAPGSGHSRLFVIEDMPGVMPTRSAHSAVAGIRCARTVDTTPPTPPVQPTCTSNCEVTSLGVGERFGCAGRADGSVWCWGTNQQGALGTNDIVDAMPASVAKPAIMSGVAKVDAGNRFACARTTAGAIQCWGDNSEGQLGDGSGTTRIAPVMTLTGTSDFAVAGSHGCAILTDTSISCWGRGGATQAPSQPTAIGITGATVIEAGANSECAIVGASVRCWGVIHDNAGTLGFIAPGAARTFSIAATQIAVGDGHACAVVGTTVQCWGDRTHWGGTGVATSAETLSLGTLVAPKVFASDGGTVVLDQGAIVFNMGSAVPGGLTVDGAAIAFGPGSDGSGCATVGTGASCFGVERGQLGRSNGCDATPATSTLMLP